MTYQQCGLRQWVQYWSDNIHAHQTALTIQDIQYTTIKETTQVQNMISLIPTHRWLTLPPTHSLSSSTLLGKLGGFNIFDTPHTSCLGILFQNDSLCSSVYPSHVCTIVISLTSTVSEVPQLESHWSCSPAFPDPVWVASPLMQSLEGQLVGRAL